MNLLNMVGFQLHNLYLDLLSILLKKNHNLYMYMDLLSILLKQQHDLHMYRNLLN